jgi:sugar/nucleoside kinase (ribokinase family)
MPVESHDLVLIGHLSKDIIIIDDERKHSAVGGSVYYAAFAAKPAGIQLLVITKLAIQDYGMLGDFWRQAVPVLPLFCGQTTMMEDIFGKHNNYARRSRVLSLASPFTAEDIPVEAAKIYLIAGLLYGEVPEPLIEELSGRGKVAVDAQTFLRRRAGTELVHEDWGEKEKYLPLIDFFKADIDEAKILTGEQSLEAILEKLHTWGVKEAMITETSGVTVSDGSARLFAPFPSYNIESRSGRGDTCFASYLSWRIHNSPAASTEYAAQITSKKLQRPGPYMG